MSSTQSQAGLEPARAAAALEDAFDREEVFSLVLNATRSRLDFAALLVVHHDMLRGWRVLADASFEVRDVETLEVPRSVPAIEAVIASASPSITKLATGDMFVDGLLEVLGGVAPQVLLLPICVQMHALAIVVAHRGEESFAYGDVADLFPLLADADAALDRVTLLRKKSAAARAPSRAESPLADYEIEISYEEEHASRRAATVSHRDAQSWPDLAESIRELIRDGVDHGDPGEEEQLELLLELGQIELEHLRRPEAAIEAWRSALTIDASDVRVLDALEQLYAKRGRWLDCVELLDKRVALLDEQGPRIAMLLNVAAIARDRLGDPRRAIEALERVVAMEPGHPAASPQLEALYRAKQEWGPVAAQMLDRASRDTDEKSSVAALVEVAEVYEQKVGDPGAAVLVWLTVLRRDPTRAGLLDDIERLGDAAGAWDELAGEVASIAEELERAQPAIAAATWHLAARWRRDRIGDRVGAVGALERALRITEGTDDVELASILHEELGELHEADPVVATVHYEQALVGRPESPQLLVALHRLYLANQAWTEIATLLPTLIDALAPSAQVATIVDLYVELGAVYADRLDRPDDAIDAYQDALALDPKHQLAQRSLASIYERTGNAEALLETTEADVDGSSRAVQLARYGDLAAAWHEHQRFDRAIACWHKLLALDPDSALAHEGLVRTLGANHQWVDIANALRARIRRNPANYDRLVLLELAELLATKLDDVSGATVALEEITAREPDDPAALDALARLHDRAGRLRPALEALERLLAQTNDSRARADLYQRIAQIHLAARDAATARVSLVQAIALDKDNASAREAMARVHLQQGELVSAGEELLRAARLHAQQADILRCLADAAWLYRHRLEDNERARECLHRILEIAPDHADAKQALADLLADNQEWESLWPHLVEQVSKARLDQSAPPADRRDVFMKAAHCAVELGKFAQALELYDLAAQTAPDPSVQILRADALYRSKAIDGAIATLQALVNDAANLERIQRIAVYRRLAQIHTELGKPAQAQQWHTKVLDLDPAHRDTLSDLVELHLAQERYDDAIASLRELASAVTPTAERVSLLERIGDLYHHKLANPGRAMSTYLDALELDGGNRRVLQRLLDLQTKSGQWGRAVETIGKFLECETEGALRGRYFLASAAIKRTELRDAAGAFDDYEHALDELLRLGEGETLQPATRLRAIDAFRDLDALMTEERDWKSLEQAYRRMIKRVPTGDSLLVPLWHALGELYRKRLDHVQSAIQAFEIAHAIDPSKSPARAKILAELYARTGAVKPTAALVETDPSNPETYRKLAETALAAGRIDEAWCACRALVVLKQATFDEELLYKKYQPHEVRKAKGVLDADAWAHVRHPDEDRVISSIFALVWEPLVALRAGTAKSFDLKPKDRIPIEEDNRVVARIFRHAARILNVALPDVYAQPRRSGSLLLANCIDTQSGRARLVPAVIVGRDMMTGYRDTEIAAAVGAMVALLRPAYYLKLAMTTNEELEAAIAAVAQLLQRNIGRPELEPLVSVFAPAIKASLTRPVAETLLQLVERLPERLDLAKWRASVDAAAHRAGFLVAGELAASAKMLALAGPRPAQRIGELVAFSVSPAYLSLREHLGVAIKPK
jgi:tetratricopeptide (TPR) repeat protein